MAMAFSSLDVKLKVKWRFIVRLLEDVDTHEEMHVDPSFSPWLGKKLGSWIICPLLA